MARQLNSLPGCEVAEDVPTCLLQFLLNQYDFLINAEIGKMTFRMFSQLDEFLLELDDRLLEVENMFH